MTPLVACGYLREDSDTEVKAGCGVRLRIIGVTVGAELVRTSEEREDQQPTADYLPSLNWAVVRLTYKGENLEGVLDFVYTVALTFPCVVVD